RQLLEVIGIQPGPGLHRLMQPQDPGRLAAAGLDLLQHVLLGQLPPRPHPPLRRPSPPAACEPCEGPASAGTAWAASAASLRSKMPSSSSPIKTTSSTNSRTGAESRRRRLRPYSRDALTGRVRVKWG